jgi:hypothetical protein
MMTTTDGEKNNDSGATSQNKEQQEATRKAAAISIKPLKESMMHVVCTLHRCKDRGWLASTAQHVKKEGLEGPLLVENREGVGKGGGESRWEDRCGGGKAK